MRTIDEVLADVSSGKLDPIKASVEINAIADSKPKVVKVKPFGMKIAPKSGTLSVYGLQRFPVSLHPSQWLRVIDHAADIQKFIADNDGKFIITQDKDGKPLAQPVAPKDETAPTAGQTTDADVGDLDEVLGAG